jgi:hypothetical protein
MTVLGETNALITGLVNDTLHYVWVKGANNRNESPFSNRASCTPAIPPLNAPAGLAVTPGNGNIRAEWQAVSGATEYRVYCGTEQNPPTAPVMTVQSETSALITGLVNDTLHYVWVRAANSETASPYSNRASCTPAAPLTTLAWSGNWIRNSENNYTSNSIGFNYNYTWETLAITTNYGCSLLVSLTAEMLHSSVGNYAYGYALKLDSAQSTGTVWDSSIQLEVQGTTSRSYTYTIPAGVHTIHFGFQSGSSSSGSLNDKVTVTVQVQ